MQIILGTLLIGTAALFTGYQEVGLVRITRSVEESIGLVKSLSSPTYDSSKNGELIHCYGRLHSKEPFEDGTIQYPLLADESFGIAVNGVRLLRSVEMMQWVETRTSSAQVEDDGFGESSTQSATYSMEWREEAINSDMFLDTFHVNPSSMAWKYQSKIIRAKVVALGDFEIDDRLIDQMERRDRIKLNKQNLNHMQSLFTQRRGVSMAHKSLNDMTHSENDYFYILRNTPTQPSVGDLRISFHVLPAATVSICAQQSGTGFVPFRAEAGESIFLLDSGIKSPESMLEKHLYTRVKKNRFLRIFTSVIAYIGFNVIYSRIPSYFSESAEHNPGLQPIMTVTMSIACIASITSLIWAMHSPFWSASILLGIGCLFPIIMAATKRYLSRRKAE